ncbi:MAG: nitrilase-related carbon-nitrogen hydrolase [Owenweeksia sp.]|nr:nitrilase-related carbon-nitrogen hydrolase [Owenweeksia sp.]
MDQLELALVQSSLHWEDKAANFKHFENLLSDIKGVDLLLLPEMFTTGFSMHPAKLYDEARGQTLKWLQQMAAQTGYCNQW